MVGATYMLKRLGTLFALAGLGACASSSDEISSAYVSPLEYENYSCKQLTLEGERVSARAATLAGRIDDSARDDKIVAGVGAVLFWPALFFIDGDGPEATEYARLKGQRDAIEEESIRKNCRVEFRDDEG